MGYLKRVGLQILHQWIKLVQHNKIVIILLCIAIAAISLNYTKNNLGMNTDTKDMLSPELPWRKLDLEYEQYFPQYPDNILIVVEAETPDQAIDAADMLYQQLLSETELFKSIYYPSALSIFKDSALLYLESDELQDLADNLAIIQPFLSRLTDDQSIRGLFSMLSEAIEALEDGEEIELEPLLLQINQALMAAANQETHRVSWQSLMSGEDNNKPINRQFILLQPVLDYSSLLPGKPAIDRINEIGQELGIEQNVGANIRLTGSAVLSYEEMISVTRGTEIAMILALCMVTAIMLFGLGSLRLMIATLSTLIFGLILTAAFATFAIGKLNLISVAFAVLYIGLGVDFAIHYCLRYRELLIDGLDNKEALQESSINIGSSLFLCAITTAIGFFAFIPTDYDGVAELGLISGIGMFISLIVTLTLLPALLGLMPLRVKSRKVKRSATINKLLLLPLTKARTIKILSVLVVVLLLGLLSGVRFDYNTLNLQDPDNESVQTYQDLLADSNTSPWTGIILAKGKQEALQLYDKFTALPLVKKVIWIDDFIPPEQDEKLIIIDDMSLLLGDIPDESSTSAITNEQRLDSILDFKRKLEGSKLVLEDDIFAELLSELSSYIAILSAENEETQVNKLQALEESLLASLPGRLDTLRSSLNADYITYDSLPRALVQRWHSGADHYLLEIYPRENISDNDLMRRFVEELQSADPRVIGSPIVNLEASDAVIKAFRQAFVYAFIVITIFLLILLSRKQDAVYVLAPLLMAAVCTGGISVLFDLPLNFANVIALPLLLGIGVDSGIHILHRFRTALPDDHNLLATSSARAVVVSTLTTIGSIGNLAFSPHLGTASMGKMLTIGIAATLVCMLIVLPSLLYGKSIPQEP